MDKKDIDIWLDGYRKGLRLRELLDKGKKEKGLQRKPKGFALPLNRHFYG